MKKPLFTGVCTALVTPFYDGKVNYPMAEQLLRRQLDAGIQAVVLAGTTGESPTLSDYEKLELFRRSKQYTGDDCMIIAGTAGGGCPADRQPLLQQSKHRRIICTLFSHCKRCVHTGHRVQRSIPDRS